jgi:TolB-like protein
MSRRIAGSIARASLVVSVATAVGCSWMQNAPKATVIPIVGHHSDLRVEAVRSIKTIQVRRIAVMPIVEDPGADKAIADGASESISAELYSQMSLAAGWEVIPESDVADQLQKLPPPTMANLQDDAIALGHALSADAVLYGSVQRYRERVGVDYAAQSPASVSFKLHLIDVNLKQVVWTASFDRTQKALTENVFNLVEFVKSNGRWVRAHEIANQGVEEAVANLHDSLNLLANVNRFEAGSYEEMKSGAERYRSEHQVQGSGFDSQ